MTRILRMRRGPENWTEVRQTKVLFTIGLAEEKGETMRRRRHENHASGSKGWGGKGLVSDYIVGHPGVIIDALS